MNVAFDPFSHPVILGLGSWLLHFLWQGTVVTLLLAALLIFLKRATSEVRYVACWVALTLMVVLPTLSTLTILPVDGLEIPSSSAVNHSGAFGATDAHNSQLHTGAEEELFFDTPFIPRAVTVLVDLRAYFVYGWMLGVMFFAFRLQSGIQRTAYLKTASSYKSGELPTHALAALCKKMNIRQKVRVTSSIHIDQPILIGWIKPVILLPASILTGLPAGHINAILAHELAHIKRHNYLFSLIQSVVETLLFFHPAIWWISHQIRTEREYCCDALAIATLSSKKIYLKTLADLEAHRASMIVPRFSLSMKDGSLLDRVNRIVLPPNPETNMKSIKTVMGLTFFVCLSILATSGLSSPLSSTQNTPAIQSGVNQTSTQHTIEINPTIELNVTVNRHLSIELSPEAKPEVEPKLETGPGTTQPVSVFQPTPPSRRVSLDDDTPSLHPLKKRVKITSGFGQRMHPILKTKKMHNGIDFLASMSTPVYATADGTVTTVSNSEGHGNYIIISHTGGFETVYTTLSTQDVQEGTSVKKGDKIGESGNSGLSTAPHLHYEVHLNGKPVNPADYLPKTWRDRTKK